MVNFRTFVLNDCDFKTISGQRYNFGNFRSAGTPATDTVQILHNTRQSTSEIPTVTSYPYTGHTVGDSSQVDLT